MKIKFILLILAGSVASCLAQPAIGPTSGGVREFTFLDGNGFHGTVTKPKTTPTLSLRFDVTQPKGAVDAATTGNITLSGVQSFDGYTTSSGSRVLVKNQTSPSQNGIYIAAAGAWARSSDADTGDEVFNATCLVLNGTVNNGTTWQCNTPAPIVIGTTAITFVETSPSITNFARGAGTLNVSTVNDYSIAQHTHAITSSSNPGGAASLLATNGSGYLQLARLGIGVSPTQPLEVGGNVFIDSPTANLFMKDVSTGLQAAASTIVTPQVGNVLQNTSFASGIRGWNIRDDGDAEFNNMLIRGELRASVFRINEITATAGTFGVFFSATTLSDDVTTPAVGVSFDFNGKNSDAGGSLLEINDVVRFKTWTGFGIGDSWALITAKTNNGTTTTYSATLESGSTGVTFTAGSAIVDYGPSGTGFITQSADGTIGSSPNLTMATHTGSPWNDQTLLLRMGNLNGSYGYGANVYGLGIGSYGVPGQSWQVYDTTNGIRIGNNVSTIGQWDAAGNLTLGTVATNQGNAHWDNTTKRIEFRGGTSGTTVEAYIDTDGSIGAGGNPAQVRLNSTGISIASPSTFDTHNSLRWMSGSTARGTVYNASNSSASLTAVQAGGVAAGQTGQTELDATNGTHTATFAVVSTGGNAFASVDSSGGTFVGLNVGAVGSPLHMLDVQGKGFFQVGIHPTIVGGNAPVNSTDPGETGEITWNSVYLFVCIAPNTWKRVALSSW